MKILAKYLDAKLTVCQCSFGKNIEVIFEIEDKFKVNFVQTLLIEPLTVAKTLVQENNNGKSR